MTILVSTASDKLIVMLSDSAITTHFTEESGDCCDEYSTGSKYDCIPGAGCITTWGDRTYNRLGSFLRDQNVLTNTPSIQELANLIRKYLSDEYPKDDLYEIGYHIGGFGRDGHPHLYHAYWGFERPKLKEQTSPAVQLKEHTDWDFLYNGRNDLADTVMATLVNEIRAGQKIRFDLTTAIGRICLCDFVARFAAEITPQVGPPFVIHLIFPDNTIQTIVNMSFSPITVHSIASALPRLASGTTITPTKAELILPGRTPSNYQGGTVEYIPPSGIGGSPL